MCTCSSQHAVCSRSWRPACWPLETGRPGSRPSLSSFHHSTLFPDDSASSGSLDSPCHAWVCGLLWPLKLTASLLSLLLTSLSPSTPLLVCPVALLLQSSCGTVLLKSPQWLPTGGRMKPKFLFVASKALSLLLLTYCSGLILVFPIHTHHSSEK